MESFLSSFCFYKTSFYICHCISQKKYKTYKKHFALFLLTEKFGDFYEYEEIKVKMLTFGVGLTLFRIFRVTPNTSVSGKQLSFTLFLCLSNKLLI